MTDNTNRLKTLKPGLFSPTTIRALREGGGSKDSYVNKSDSTNYTDSVLGSTSSFKYDIQGSGLKSTQQLNIDWSKFENHTFFNSAQVKTNVAFDTIINNYPFDGTKEEIESFFEKLTGFETHVFSRFPKNIGYLHFSGSAISDPTDTLGTYVAVKDIAGAQYPTLSRLRTGETLLDPGLNSFSIESWLYVNKSISGSRVSHVASKISSSTGYAVEATTTSSSDVSTVSMIVVSGGIEQKTSMNIPVDQWTHVHFAWDRTPGINQIYGYANGDLQASSSMPVEYKAMNIGSADFYVGSGSALGTSIPNCTFSGSIDELRVWHAIRSNAQRKEKLRKPVYAEDNLKLYFKFNEPSGSNSNVVLDSSGNSIHGRLNSRGLTLGVRELATGSLAGSSPMLYESLDESPILFPTYEDIQTLRDELLTSGSLFDTENENLITKLIPKHYFDEGMIKDGLEDTQGTILTDLDGSSPGSVKLGQSQILSSMLYVWAKFFDEIKLYIQAFSSLKSVDYDLTDTVPNDFLSVFARNEGIELPPLFTGSDIEQYIEGQNIDTYVSRNIASLQSIQNMIWRRILINLQDVLKSKGTIHSIKSFIRSTGIDPDNNFRIREYGGPSKKPLTFNREKRFEVSTMLNFISGGIIISNELTGSAKTEPGFPEIGPTGSHNQLLTSGSFTFEGIYKWEQRPNSLTQSLSRIEHVPSSSFFGAQDSADGREFVANLLAISSSSEPTRVELVVRSVPLSVLGVTASNNALSLAITGVDLFDGNKWNVSWGRRRGDDGFDVPSYVSFPSSSYFLRVAKQQNGEVLESYVTSAYYDDNKVTGNDTYSVWQNNTYNTKQLRLVVGSGSHAVETDEFLSSTFQTQQNFSGKVSQIRFWSKFLLLKEWNEHIVNYRSVGTLDPATNFNFVGQESYSRFTGVTGSWARLRIDASTDQIVTSSANNVSGNILLTDFTQNAFNTNTAPVLNNVGLGEKIGAFPAGFFGTGFPAATSIIQPEQFYFSFLSPKIDEGVQTNKVRVRGFSEIENVEETPWAELGPVYFVNPNEETSDSSKLSIDFSIIDTLDQDIMTIFSSLDEFNNALGDPELMFADGYKDLEIMREMYFEKLKGKINIKGFFEFFKWFDTNIGSFVEQLVPRKTKYLGTNFIIESHVLERNKIRYYNENIYLGEDIRSGLRDRLLLQLITGDLSKF